MPNGLRHPWIAHNSRLMTEAIYLTVKLINFIYQNISFKFPAKNFLPLLFRVLLLVITKIMLSSGAPAHKWHNLERACWPSFMFLNLLVPSPLRRVYATLEILVWHSLTQDSSRHISRHILCNKWEWKIKTLNFYIHLTAIFVPEPLLNMLRSTGMG